MPVKVKICGIRSIAAAKVAVGAGADFLGFNFVPASKRNINPSLAEKIINAVGGKVKIVGVFQDADINYLNNLSFDLGLDFVQLHGKEDAEYLRAVKLPVIKAIQIDGKPEEENAAYFLLDRTNRKGEMVDFKKASQMASKIDLFFAGGLNPENVADVIRNARPFAVDVAGGIETEGKEDLKKIDLFIRNAKGAI